MRYCKNLSLIGVGKDFFTKNVVYNPLSSLSGWPKLLADAVKNKKRVFSKSRTIIRTIDSLVEKDQRLNLQWRQSGMASRERTLMDLTNDTIANHLKHLFDSIGFMSEETLGPPLTKDGLLSYRMPFDIIIIHNFQARMVGDTLFSHVLKQALEGGLIKPEYYAFFEDFGGGDYTKPYYGTSHFYIQNKCSIYLEGPHFENLSNIENARARIGLSTTEDYLKKVIFNIIHPGNSFKINASASQVSYGNQESEDMMKKTGRLVLQYVPGCKN